MATACFRCRQPVVIDGEQRILTSRVGDDWQMKDPKDGRITSLSLPSLRRKYADGSLQFIIKDRLSSDISKELRRLEPRGKPEDVIDEVWKLACAKLALVKEVWCLPWQSSVQKQRIRELWPKLTTRLKVVPLIPDVSTVHRWWSKLDEYGWDARALLPQDCKKGRRREALTGELLDLVDEGVEDSYMTLERLPREEAYKATCILVDARNAASPHLPEIARPSQRQVYRYISELDAFDVYAARYGHSNAIRRFRAVHGRTIATRPLERVELDHTVLDVIVLDDKTLLPLGRPTLAIAIDVFTRCIVGFYIGFEPPSSSTVGQCLKSVLLPKTFLLEGVPSITGSWDVYGQMEILILDQALENHARTIERGAGCLGIELGWCGSKMPWQKGTVERLIGTVNRGFCHRISGTTRSNIQDKGEYDAVGRAVCTLSALRKGLVLWIVDRYHVHWHRSLQMAPIGKWQTSIKEDDIPLATDIMALETCLRIPKVARLTHKGVERNNQLYNSDELTSLRLKYGSELDVIVYESLSDLGSVIVEHDESNLRAEVPCLNQDYAKGLTQWQDKAIRKFARDQSIGVASFADQLKAKALLEAVIYEGMADSPLKTRVMAARLLQRTRESQAGQYEAQTSHATGSSLVGAHATASDVPDGISGDEFDGLELEMH